PRDHDENAPQSEDYTRYRRQHLDQRNNRLPNPERRKFRKVNRSRDAQRHSDEQRNKGRNQRSVNKWQRAKLLRDRVPGRGGEKMKPKFLNRERRSTPQLPADYNDEQNHRHRHGEGKP